MKFFSNDDYYHSFQYYDSVRSVQFNGRTQIITLELSKLEEIVEKPIDKMSLSERWAVFFEYLTIKDKRGIINKIVDQDEGIAMAGQVLMDVSQDENERARLLSEYKYEMDMQSKLVTAKREGMQEITKDILEMINQVGSLEELKEKIIQLSES